MSMLKHDKVQQEVTYVEYVAFLCPGFLLLSVPIRILITKFKIPIPQEAFLFVLSTMAAMWLSSSPALRSIKYLHSVPPYQFMAIFMPIFIFEKIYCLDLYTFLKSLPQVLLITIFGVGTYTIGIAFIFHTVIHPYWTFPISFLAALACAPINVNDAAIRFLEMEKHRHLSTIIRSEAILTFCIILIVFDIYLGYIDGVVTLWYHFTTIFIRYVSISFIVGWITGKITTSLLCYLYNEPKSALCISVAMTFFTYFLVQFLLASSGLIAVVCMSYFVAVEKHRLSAEVDSTLSDFWRFLSYMCAVMWFCAGVLAIVTYSYYYFSWDNILGGVILYLSSNILRFLIFVFLSPILNFFSYKLNFKCLIALIWSGAKGGPNFFVVLILMAEQPHYLFRDFVTDFSITCFLSILINTGTVKLLLKLIGLAEHSSLRISNMNQCMRFIMEKRACMLHTLKNTRIFSDANWPLTREDTILKHPYKGTPFIDSDSDEEDDSSTRQATITCPDCSKEIPFDMSDQDHEELTREARIIILKAKRVSIIKQYENGFIDKKCMEVLLLNFQILINFINKGKHGNPIKDLEKIVKEDSVLGRLRKIITMILFSRDHLDPPSNKQPWRRLSFFIVNHILYDYATLLFLIIIYTISYVSFIWTDHIIYFTLFCTTRLYFIGDIVLKVAALSKTSMANGIKKFFKSYINIIDLICLIVNLIEIVFVLVRLTFYHTTTTSTYASMIVSYARLYKVGPVIQHFFPNLIQAINRKIDGRLCFGYDLAAAMVITCDEILTNLKNTIDVKVIRIALYNEIQEERNNIIKIMEMVQREKPWISITIKTKQAIRSTLRSMEESLNDMKIQGFIDNTEYAMIFKEIFERQKFLRNLTFVQSSPPKIIFNEVPWMANDEKIIQYLYRNVEKVTWEAGQSICKEGKYSQGVYIVLSGLLRLKYKPNEKVLGRLNKLGSLPIVDYLSTLDFYSYIQDNVMSGNSIGELSILTGRPYNCSIVADTFCQAYLLKTEVIKNAMRLNAHPLTGLETRLWKCSIINLAVTILSNSPLYQSFTQDQIKFKLERSFMPNLSCYKMFVISELMDEVILIEGVASDYNSGEVFTAPVVLPRTIQKVILPRSSYLTLEEKVETKLLIIPVGETQAFDLMEAEEEVAELVSLPSSKCLLHTVQDRYWRQRKPFVRKKVLDEILTRDSVISIDTRTSDEKFEVIEPAEERHFSYEPTKYEFLLLQNKKFDVLSEESVQDDE